MKNYYIALLFICLMPKLLAQEIQRTGIKGKISSSTNELGGIYIVNKKTEKVTVSERGGYFNIEAIEGDSLMFSSIQFKAKTIIIAKEDIESAIFFVKLEQMTHQLDEVKIVRYDNINAVALGIIPKSTKRYTTAERKLKTAGDLKPQDFLGLLGGGMETDPIINAITGRTAMLKKEVEVERKEFLIAALENMFDGKYFTEKLKVPEIYIKGFLFYVVENDKFVAIFKSGNKTMSTFLLGELANKYNEIISCESE